MLDEAGARGFRSGVVKVEAHGLEVSADWTT